MKNHYSIRLILVLGVLLVLVSSELLIAEDGIESAPTLSDSVGVTPQTTDSPTFFPKLTKVLQSVAIVIILIVGTVFFLKKKFGLSKAVGGKKYMHVVESVPVGAKRFLLLVKVPGKLLVVGTTNDHIHPVAEITDKTVVDTVSPSSDNNDFMGFLKKVCLERRQVRAMVSENNH